MTVSVIIPCWRCSLALERAIASIASQTYPALEVIAVDEASGDGTLAELSSIACRYPTGWIRVIGRADNGGPGLARNTGWDVALGDYVAFLDADDAWHPKKLELHIGWLAKHPEAVLSGTRSLVLKDGPVPVAHAVFRARRVGFAQIFISTQFITRTVVVKREIRLRFEGRRVAEDFLLWARIVATGAPC